VRLGYATGALLRRPESKAALALFILSNTYLGIILTALVLVVLL